MTIDERRELKALLSAQLDTFIEERVTALWLKLEAQVRATMPADGEPLGPDPCGPWQPVSIESVVMQERHRLEAWKEPALEELLASSTVWQTVAARGTA